VLTASQKLLEEHPLSYALIRPPGHHSEKKVFGGFCYFNNVAIAANFLSEYGKVAVLDIDYHHGNGQQDIFYHRNDVFTISIHGHPSFAYPYFTGFIEEKGIGDGIGFNNNYPLPETCSTAAYQETLVKALKKIKTFSPRFLLVSLGFDIGKGDPTGTWSFTAPDFYKNGYLIGQMKIPMMVVQEGGYKNVSLGINARHFFKGLWDGRFSNSTNTNQKK